MLVRGFWGAGHSAMSREPDQMNTVGVPLAFFWTRMLPPSYAYVADVP